MLVPRAGSYLCKGMSHFFIYFHRMLLDKGKMSPEIIRIMDRWRHSGFNVYEVDSLECPRCSAQMRVIFFITDPLVVRRILEYLGLWLARA